MSVETSMRKVDLTDQIILRMAHGLPVAPEDIVEAEELGIDLEAIRSMTGSDEEIFYGEEQ